MKQQIYDISLPLSLQTKVFPGDAPLQYRFTLDMNKGDAHNLSEFSATTHIGTHVDSPLHYVHNAPAIAEIDLQVFMGFCKVIRLKDGLLGTISASELSKYTNLPERVLLCTTTTNCYDKWTSDYRTLSIEAADYLYAQGVKLIGIDAPSVEPTTNKNGEVHKRLFEHGIMILENLYMNEVPEGDYELIALPLRFTELEGSPVRAILRTL